MFLTEGRVMSNIKDIINSISQMIDQLDKEPLSLKNSVRNGNGQFQGTSVNAVAPPTDSPLVNGVPTAGQTIANPSLTPSSAEYLVMNDPSRTISNDLLFNYATNSNAYSPSVANYLLNDLAANKAVADIRKASSEIGSLEREPKLSAAVGERLAQIASQLFNK